MTIQFANASSLFKNAIAERITAYKVNRERFSVDMNYTGVEVAVTDRTNGEILLVSLMGHSSDEIRTPYSLSIKPVDKYSSGSKRFNESANLLASLLSK